MPTLQGMRRRGYTSKSIRDFCEKVGVAKRENVIEVELLEHCLRHDLNLCSPRRLGVLDPLKVTISNYPEDQVETVDAVNNPEDPDAGTRPVPFSKHLYVDRNDFMEDPPKKYFRMTPGREVRLKYAYYVTCTEVVKDEEGNITELICEYDTESRGGGTADGRKVKGTIQWVDASSAQPCEVRLYDRLFNKPDPEKVEEGGDFTDNLNPDSLEIIHHALVEPSVTEIPIGQAFQLERVGYFCLDSDKTEDGKKVLNRTVAMRDSWAKINK
jgi:glutaminyl-tRNA synthetase